MNLSQLARFLHRAEVITRDVNAVKKGRVVQRVENRIIGRAVGRAMRGLWR